MPTKSKYVIFLLSKHYRGGSHSDYVVINRENFCNDTDSDETLTQAVMEWWGEREDGGSEDGYRVYCEEIITSPSPQLLDFLKKKTNKRIADYLTSVKASIEGNIELLKWFDTLPVTKIPAKYRKIYDKLKGGCKLTSRRKYGPNHPTYITFDDGTTADPKAIEYLIDKKYIIRGMSNSDRDTFTFEYKINI